MNKNTIISIIDDTLKGIDIRSKDRNYNLGARRGLWECKDILTADPEDARLMLENKIYSVDHVLSQLKDEGIRAYHEARKGAYKDILYLLNTDPEPEPIEDDLYMVYSGRAKLWTVSAEDKARLEKAGKLVSNKRVYVNLHFIPW